MVNLMSTFALVAKGNPAAIEGAFDRDDQPHQWFDAEPPRRELSVEIELTDGSLWQAADRLAALRA